MNLPDYLLLVESSQKLIQKIFSQEERLNKEVHVFEFKQINPNPHPELLTLEFKPGTLKKVMEIYYSLPNELHGVFGPWTHWMPKRIMKEKGFMIDANDINLNQYRMFLDAFGDFVPYLKDVRFFVTRESSPASEKKPWIDEMAIQKGQFYFYRHHYQKTGKDEEEDRLDYYRKLFQQSPNDNDFRRFFQKELLVWIEILLNDDLLSDAKKYLDEAKVLGSNEVNLWYLMGEYEQKTGEWQSALRYFKKALAIEPKHYLVSRKLADYYFYHKQYQKSAEAYTNAIANFPKKPIHYFDRGLCYKKLGKEHEAQSDFKKTIHNTLAKNASHLARHAYKLFKTGYTEDAIIFYKATFKKSRQYATQKSSRKLLEKGAYNPVVLNEIIKSGFEALLEIAKIEEQRGNWKKAIKCCDQILNIQFDYGRALILKGCIFLRLKKIKKLAEVVDTLNVLESHNPITYILEGGMHIYAKEYEKAIEAYQRAIKININFYEAYHGVGHALAWMRRDREALEYFQKALDIYDKDAACLADMASSLNNLGREEEALEYLKKAIALRSDYYHPYLIKACILAKKGNSKESVKLLRQVLKLDPSQKKWLEQEGDFHGIRQTSEFRRLLRDIKNENLKFKNLKNMLD